MRRFGRNKEDDFSYLYSTLDIIRLGTPIEGQRFLYRLCNQPSSNRIHDMDDLIGNVSIPITLLMFQSTYTLPIIDRIRDYLF